MHLSEYMAKLRLNDREVAEKTGISRPTVSRIRRGKQFPDRATLITLKEWSKGKISADSFLEEIGA